jgi:predicted dehydrogenase
MLYRVNAGYAPAGNEQQRQGGRIVGEGCHFIDTLVAITGERVERVAATSVTSHNASLVDADSTTIVLEHANGHLGTIHYLARGSSLLEKEYLEVHGGGRSAVLRDYRRLELYADGRPKTMWRLGQDKGHAEQLRQVVEAVRTGKPAPVPFEELLHVTEVSFEAAAQVGGLTNAD